MLRRLVPGFALILAAAAALLVSDAGRRRGGGPAHAAADTDRAVPGRTYSIGIVWFAPDPVVDLEIVGLLKGLAERGFVKGENLSVLTAHAQGDVSNLAAIVKDFDSRGLGALVPMTTPALVGSLSGAKRTPVVFSGVYDPIAAGAGKSFSDHLPFVTGVSSFPDIARTVETIQRLVPGARSVGTLYNPSEPNSSKVVKVSRDLFRAASLRLEETSIASTAEAVPAVDVLVGRGVDAIWVTGDNTALQAFPAIAGAATRARLPLVNNHVEFLRNGGLASVGTNFYESGYAAADPVARVLNGASPASIPIRNVSVPELGLNVGVARALGLSFPPDLVAQARAFPGLGAWLGRPARLALAADEAVSEAPVPGTPVRGASVREALVKGLDRAGLKEGSDFVLARWRDGKGEPEPDILFDARSAAAGGQPSVAGPGVPSLPVGPGEESASRAAVEAVRRLVDVRGSGRRSVLSPRSRPLEERTPSLVLSWKSRKLASSHGISGRHSLVPVRPQQLAPRLQRRNGREPVEASGLRQPPIEPRADRIPPDQGRGPVFHFGRAPPDLGVPGLVRRDLRPAVEAGGELGSKPRPIGPPRGGQVPWNLLASPAHDASGNGPQRCGA